MKVASLIRCHLRCQTSVISRKENAEGGAVTLYRLTISKSLVGAKPFLLNLLLNDDDAGYLKQMLHLGDVEKPASGLRLMAE